jgi:hypothetical protein
MGGEDCKGGIKGGGGRNEMRGKAKGGRRGGELVIVRLHT